MSGIIENIFDKSKTGFRLGEFAGEVKAHGNHRGHTYYFCSESCLDQFRADPAKFLEPRGKDDAATAADLEAEYTCPMHPEIRQKGPGSCPLCGMALEPVTVTLEDQPNEELEDMTPRFPIRSSCAR